jgi:stalled ribosome rescue protein Dom34
MQTKITDEDIAGLEEVLKAQALEKVLAEQNLVAQ